MQAAGRLAAGRSVASARGVSSGGGAYECCQGHSKK